MPVIDRIEAYENNGSLDVSRGIYAFSNPDDRGLIATGMSRVVEFNMTPTGNGAIATDIPTIDTSLVGGPGRVDDGNGNVPIIAGVDTRGRWEAKGYF